MTAKAPVAWEHAAAVEEVIASSGFSGVVSVDSGDERIFQIASGYAHRASARPNCLDTRFAIASGSKAFTALAVMRLVDDGLLELDAPVRIWLGEDVPHVEAGVSIRHLLTHTSGIEDYLDESDDGELDDYVLAVPVHTLTTAESFLPLLQELRQVSSPGSGFAYSNAGFVILALIVERVTGQVFQDAVDSLVFAPANLGDTAFLRLDELPAGTATGYLFATGDRANTLHLPVRGNGDGGAFTTTRDLHRFWTALFGGDIVAREVVDQMVVPVSDVPEENLRYGMGFWLEREGDAVVVEGCDAGVSFRSTHEPDTATTVTVVANTSEGAWPVVRATL